MSGGMNCAVPNCHNTFNKFKKKAISNPGCDSILSFHCFPSKEELLKVWLNKIKSGKRPSKWSRVCSQHFKDDDFLIRKDGLTVKRRLKQNAVPSQQLPLSVASKPNSNEERRKRYQKRSTGNIILNSEPMDISVPEPIINLISPSDGAALSQPEGHNLPADCSVSDECTNNLLFLADVALNAELNVSGQSDATKSIGVQVHITKGDKCVPVRKHKALTSNGMRTQDLSPLTGIGEELFEGLWTEVLGMENRSDLPDFLMPVKDRVLLTLMKLKMNPTYDALASLFKISCTSVATYFKRTICALYHVLKQFIFWPTHDNVRNNLPKCFNQFANTRVVLDCTETPMMRPKSLHDRIATYSHYKGTHTIKLLIGVAPSGMITLASEAWGGKASDKLITIESDVISKCEPFLNAIMVDKGFMIEDDCAVNGITIHRPPFLRKKPQFNKEESVLNQKIASARVHVERSIQRIKLFKILNDKFDLDLVPYCDEIITVICGLVNLLKPILSDNKFAET